MSQTTPMAAAAALLRQGRVAPAERLLTQRLRDEPRDAEALDLLGLLRADQGRFDEAEALLRRALAAQPGRATTQFHLGRLLAARGRHGDAVAMLRAALRGRPDLFEAYVFLAQVQIATGDLANAERNFAAALKLRPASPTALGGMGALLNEMQRPADGEVHLRRALAEPGAPAPLRARLAHNLGVSLEMQRRYDEALEQFESALALVPAHPGTQRNRGKTLSHLGRAEAAVDAFRDAVARDPLDAEAHRELNALLYRLGRDGEFLQSYDRALERAPDAGGLLLEKGGFLLRAERFADARDCFARAARMAPQAAGPQNALAAAHAGLGAFDQAVAAYEKSIALAPRDFATRIHFAATLLEAGDAARGLALSEEALPHLGFDQSALAIHELALRANDDPRAARLADYERHVRVYDLHPPPGFASMDAFNAALDRHLDALHTDRREPVEQTLRRGTQTSEPLLTGAHALIRALRVRLDEAVGAYIAEMADGADHPLAGRRTGGFALSGSWSSRLHDRGFHTNHIHPGGWISSCYYVAVPGAVEDGAQGWIKFGEPSFAAKLDRPVRRTVKPVPGRLVLFPSYMWHGTVPFHSQQARTTIAFDAIPA